VANRERLQLLDSEREARSQAERESHEGRISGDA
jgi:hypothetical protein